MMMTGVSGSFCLMSCKKSKPDPLGMRMSLTMTCGCSFARAAMASGTEEKVLNSSSVRASAFSNTQRIDLSSSIIQIGFMMCLSDKIVYCLIEIVFMAVLSIGNKIVKHVRPGSLSHSIMP